MDIIIDKLTEYFNLVAGYFFDGGRRVNIIYLSSSLILAYYVFYKSRREDSFWRFVFNRKVWLGSSALVDYKIFLFNGVVKLLLIVPYLYLGLLLSFNIYEWLIARYDYISAPMSNNTTIILYTFTLTVANDFFAFLTHWAMHKIPFLWEFHKTHHSATRMNPMTQYRLHPIELIINNIIGTFAFGTITGVFSYLSMGNISKWEFLGANVFSVIFFVCGANLRHSHIRLRYFKWLEHIFISPLQHQIHHSRASIHWNKNFGSHLALWDWLFGTLHLSDKEETLSFGLGGKDDINYRSFLQNILRPIMANLQRVFDIFIK
ncbi:MAG: hypothetical protein CSA89_01200 [Bacteroidales bacterium]|nr:MAG: hypothetical protein CSA89_01200 [Bacteroidales bacterium]